MVHQKATSEVLEDARRLGQLLRMISQTAVLLAKRSTGPEAASIADLADDLTKLASKFEALELPPESDV